MRFCVFVVFLAEVKNFASWVLVLNGQTQIEKQAGQAAQMLLKSRSRKQKEAYCCITFDAYCLLSCRDNSTLIVFTLPTDRDLASRPRSPKRA